jgi:hypothetical protein
MDKPDMFLLNTYYDRDFVRKVIALLEREGIEYIIKDRSNPLNFRVPFSTYTEVDVLIDPDHFERISDLLDIIR